MTGLEEGSRQGIWGGPRGACTTCRLLKFITDMQTTAHRKQLFRTVGSEGVAGVNCPPSGQPRKCSHHAGTDLQWKGTRNCLDLYGEMLCVDYIC